MDQAIKQLGHLDQNVWQRYVDPSFLANHKGVQFLERPAWDNPRTIVVEIQEPEQPEQPAEPPEPKYLTFMRGACSEAMRGTGADVIARLADKETFDASDLAAAMKALGMAAGDFAKGLGVSTATLWSLISGKRRIRTRVQRRMRWLLGLTWTRHDTPLSTCHEAMRALEPNEAVKAVLSAAAFDDAGLSVVAQHLATLDAKHVARRLRAAGIQSWRIRFSRKRPSEAFRDQLRWAYGLTSFSAIQLPLPASSDVRAILSSPTITHADVRRLCDEAATFGVTMSDISRLFDVDDTCLANWFWHRRRTSKVWAARFQKLFGLDGREGGAT